MSRNQDESLRAMERRLRNQQVPDDAMSTTMKRAEEAQDSWVPDPSDPVEQFKYDVGPDNVQVDESGRVQYVTPRSRRVYQNVGIPLLGLIETLSSKGKSPGTAALTAGKQLQALEKQRADEALRLSEEPLKRRALEAQALNVESLAEQRAAEQAKIDTMKRLIGDGMDPDDAFQQSHPVEYAKGMSALNNWMEQNRITQKQKTDTEERLESRKTAAEDRSMERAEEAERRKQAASTQRAIGKTGKKYSDEELAGISDLDREAYQQGLAEYEAKKSAEERKSVDTKGASKIKANLASTQSLARRMWVQKMEQLKEGLPGPGLVKGASAKAGAALRIPGFEKTGAFEGQRMETAASMLRSLTGSSRLVESVYNRVIGSLPDAYDTESFSKAKLEQTLRNMYGLAKAQLESGLDPDDAETPEEIAAMEAAGETLRAADLDENDEAEIQKMLDEVFAPVEGAKTKSKTKSKTKAPATNVYASEEEARAAGKVSGDRVKLEGIGLVELE